MTETYFDDILGKGPEGKVEPIDYSLRNLTEGVIRFGAGKISPEGAGKVADALLGREQYIKDRLLPDPERVICNILWNINNPKKTGSLTHTHLSTEEIDFHTEALLAVAGGFEYLDQKKKKIEIEIGDGLSLIVDCGRSCWEGVSGIYFFAIDSKKSQQEIPLFVLRGNPIKKGEFGFEIRTIQPWVSENQPSIRSIKRREFGLAYNKPEVLTKIDEVLRERQRLLELLIRKINVGDSIGRNTKKLSDREFILLAGVAYLQSVGFKKFWGITDRMHPEARGENHVSGYDELFKKWFVEDPPSDTLHRNIYPWILDAENSECYLPGFADLPGTARRVIMDTYNKCSVK